MATPGFTAEYGLYRSTAHYSTVGYADGADGTPGFEESGVLISTAMAFAEMSENIEQVTLARFPSGSGPTYPQGGYTGFNQGFPYGFPLGSFGPNSPFNAPYDFGDLPFWPGGVPILGHRSPCDNFNCPAEYICVVTGGKPTCQTCESFCGCNCVFGACPDYQSDNLNCGGCGIPCPTGCCNGMCCPSGQNCCRGACMSSTESNKCGNCGNVCTDKTHTCCSDSCTDTQTDSSNCGACGHLCPYYLPASYLDPIMEVCCGGQCCAGGETCCNGKCLSPPDHFLGSNNYLLHRKNCGNINNLHVSLLITDDLYASSNFSLQLNALNALTPNIIWMQFIFLVAGTTITPNVQYHDISPQEPNQCSPFPGTGGTPFQIVLPPKMTNGLPAGSLLEIDLETKAGNVSQATFKLSTGTFSNNKWGNFQLLNSQPIATIPSAQQLSANKAKQACSAQQQSAMANGLPVTAFELNLVGYPGGSVSFSKGDGLITYTSDNGFCAEDGPNDICTGQNDQTGERSNASYGAMNPCCGKKITQLLSYSPGTAPQ